MQINIAKTVFDNFEARKIIESLKIIELSFRDKMATCGVVNLVF